MGLTEDQEERCARLEIEDFVYQQKCLIRDGVDGDPDPIAESWGVNVADEINAALATDAINAILATEAAAELAAAGAALVAAATGDVWDDWENVGENVEEIEGHFTSESYVPEGYRFDESGWHYPGEIININVYSRDVTQLGIAAASRRSLSGSLAAMDEELELEINSLVDRLRNQDYFVMQCGSDLDGILYLWTRDIYADAGSVTVYVRDEEMERFLLARMRGVGRCPFRILIQECSSVKDSTSESSSTSDSSSESSSTAAARKRRRRTRTRRRRRTMRIRRTMRRRRRR